MKYKFLLIAIVTFLFSINNSNAQGVELMGMTYNGQVNSVTKWNSDSVSVTSTIATNLNVIYAGSSTYDAYTGNYYVRGVENATNIGLIMQHSTITDSSNYTPAISTFNGGAEADMSSGLIYTYNSDSLNNVFFNCYNPVTKTNSNLGYFNFPAGTPLLPDATCFDSNNHIYYFITIDIITGDRKLIAVPVNSTTFTYTELTLNGTNITGYMGLEYSNTYNEIYMLYPSYAANGTSTINVATVDTATALITPIRALVDILAFYFSSRTFDQNTNQLIFMAIDTNNITNLYQYNTVIDTLTTGNLPSLYPVELECNNYSYALSKYGVTSISENISTTKQILFPNPAKDYLKISNIYNAISYTIFDANGKNVKAGLYNSSEILNIQELKNGFYVFQTADGVSLKFLKD